MREHIGIREHTLIFLHIPKAAGTTLRKIIERQYRSNAIFAVRGDRHGGYVNSSIDEFKNLAQKEKASIRFLTGHMPFGLHEYLPQPCTYITMLRDPIDRVISHYYYTRQRPGHYLYDKARRMNLEEYVCGGISPELENCQTRLLSGVREVDGINGCEPCSREVLEAAKRNLRKHFAVVGLSERFDEALIILRRAFGFRNIFYIPQNVTRARKHIPKDTSFIEERNELDMELYRYAKEMLDELIGQQGSSFERQLRNFRRWNKIYGVVNKPYNTIYESAYQVAHRNEFIRTAYRRWKNVPS